ncbi:MAG: DUF4159 domain-containing protein [Bacteroidales bacterium]|nr:DUF4159 domain-containing protein [Bacteroidales bacterium]
MKKILMIVFMVFSINAFAQKTQVAVLKYKGGGDWYSNPTSLPNLVKYCNQNINTDIDVNVAVVDVGSLDIFNYPFVHMTGHGNVFFDENDVSNIRSYLLAGGFLHIDDNYGMKDYAMSQMQKAFPELQWVELPYSHEIFKKPYPFPDGLPKIHEHDNKAPQAFALIYEGRLICLLTYECDLGDGWEDKRVHYDSNEARLKALQMGANIISYAFSY